MQYDGQIIGLYKIAPMAIFFTTASVEVMILNFVPNGFDLITDRVNIAWSNKDFFFPIDSLFIGLYKIKLAAYDFPPFLFIVVNKNFVKTNNLTVPLQEMEQEEL